MTRATLRARCWASWRQAEPKALSRLPATALYFLALWRGRQDGGAQVNDAAVLHTIHIDRGTSAAVASGFAGLFNFQMALAQFEFEHAALDHVLPAMEACIGFAAGLVGKELRLVTELHTLVMADTGAHAVFKRFGDVQGRVFG